MVSSPVKEAMSEVYVQQEEQKNNKIESSLLTNSTRKHFDDAASSLDCISQYVKFC